MQTVITKELGIVNNRLVALLRHVRLVGENSSFEIEIKKFDSEPRILDSCCDCVFVKIEPFAPVGCDDLKNMRSFSIHCVRGQNVWEETECLQFKVRL